MYTLSDIFIGEFPISQNFGERPDFYKQFGINGHNGLDIACPTGTQIVAGANGWVKEVAEDPKGYGRYIKIIHNGFLTLYAHLNDVSVKVGERVITGQLLGHTNNTGLSSGPHLHFGVAACDENGTKTEMGNGFSGYINPREGTRVQWNIVNLKEPIVTPVTTVSSSQETMEFVKHERDLNWNMAQEFASYVGLSLTDDRTRNVALFKDKIDTMKEQEVKYRQENEDLLRKHESDQREIINLKDALEKINKSDKDYAIESLEKDEKLKEAKKINKEVAKELDVSADEKDLFPRIMDKLFEWKDLLPKQPQEVNTTGSIYSDNLVSPQNVLASAGLESKNHSQGSPILQVVMWVLSPFVERRTA